MVEAAHNTTARHIFNRGQPPTVHTQGQVHVGVPLFTVGLVISVTSADIRIPVMMAFEIVARSVSWYDRRDDAAICLFTYAAQTSIFVNSVQRLWRSSALTN